MESAEKKDGVSLEPVKQEIPKLPPVELTSKDCANLIAISRRAPLMNMDEAEGVASLLQKLAAFAIQLDDAEKAKAEATQQALAAQ